jgi:type II secretory pathway pseudopilin PulG
MKISNQKGITLIQTLIFIGAIGVVVLIFTILLSRERLKTRDNIRIANIKQIQAALEMFYSQNGSYPSTANVPAREGSGHNWLPNMEDHGIQNSFSQFLPQSLTAPLSADSSICRSQMPCNQDQSSVANDFCYTAYPEGCSSAGELKCNDFLLDFCIGDAVGEMKEGRHSVTREGIR